MTNPRPTAARTPIPWPLLLFPGFKLLLHLFTVRGYGIFRDELYYLACADRLAWGYVDHPPLSMFVLRIVRETFGDGLLTLRLVPAFASAAMVLVVGLIARRLGGGVAVQALAMTAILAVPTFWGVGHVYSMNVLDGLIWSLAALLVITIVDRDHLGNDAHSGGRPARWPWLALGALLGFGLLNKLSVLWLGAGLGLGLLATRQRMRLATPGPWIAGGIATLMFAPHVMWQVRNGWPTREFIANASGEKMVSVSPVDFLRGQADLLSGPAIIVLALIGLAWLFFGHGRRFAILGWMYLGVFMLLIVNGASRASYLAPAYSWILAAGAVAIMTLIERIRRIGLRRLALTAIFPLVAVHGALAVPFALPILPVDRYIDYAETLGVVPSTEERKELDALPQFYADMHGWQDKADAARRAFDSLSLADRAIACFWSWNYGVASAIDQLGGSDLPPSLSGHNNYHLWGPRGCTGEVLIVMGGSATDLAEHFARVDEFERLDCAFCMPYEDDMSILIARGPMATFAEAWPDLKHFD